MTRFLTRKVKSLLSDDDELNDALPGLILSVKACLANKNNEVELMNGLSRTQSVVSKIINGLESL